MSPIPGEGDLVERVEDDYERLCDLGARLVMKGLPLEADHAFDTAAHAKEAALYIRRLEQELGAARSQPISDAPAGATTERAEPSGPAEAREDAECEVEWFSELCRVVNLAGQRLEGSTNFNGEVRTFRSIISIAANQAGRVPDLMRRLRAAERELADAARSPSPLPTPELGEPFERYPALASWIERLANTRTGLSLGDWMVFVGALNLAIRQAEAATLPTPEVGPGKPQDPSLDGWVVVPREPTEAMFVDGDEAILERLMDFSGVLKEPTTAVMCYRAMISAAPPFPLLGDEYSSSATEHSASLRPATPLSAGKED